LVEGGEKKIERVEHTFWFIKPENIVPSCEPLRPGGGAPVSGFVFAAVFVVDMLKYWVVIFL
jgi:hypothetical protein